MAMDTFEQQRIRMEERERIIQRQRMAEQAGRDTDAEFFREERQAYNRKTAVNRMGIDGARQWTFFKWTAGGVLIALFGIVSAIIEKDWSTFWSGFGEMIEVCFLLFAIMTAIGWVRSKTIY